MLTLSVVVAMVSLVDFDFCLIKFEDFWEDRKSPFISDMRPTYCIYLRQSIE